MLDFFHLVTWTTAPSAKFGQTISKAIDKRTFLPDLVVGHTRSNSRAGPSRESAGQDPVLVSPTPSRGNRKASKTAAISGPYGPGSSASVDLSVSLASRLQVLLASTGSTEQPLIWKQKATPSGRAYYQRAVSAHRIAETDCGLWVSPTAQDGSRGCLPARPHDTGVPLSQQVAALWSTPRATDGEKGGPHQSFGAGGTPLPAQAYQTLWPTPTHRDHKSVMASSETHDRNARPLSEVVGLTLGVWATPKESDHRPGRTSRAVSSDRINLNDQAHGTVAMWATPHSSSTGPGVSGRQGGENIQTQVSGVVQNTSQAPMEKRGGLNPAFCLWLMGILAEWIDCAPLATPSFPRSQRKS